MSEETDPSIDPLHPLDTEVQELFVSAKARAEAPCVSPEGHFFLRRNGVLSSPVDGKFNADGSDQSGCRDLDCIWSSDWLPVSVLIGLAGRSLARFLEHLPAATPKILFEIARERHRQIAHHGHSIEHDDMYVDSELKRAAATAALHAAALSARRGKTASQADRSREVVAINPWPLSSFPNTACPREALVQSAALALAAIEQLDRLEARRRRAGSDD